MNGLFYVICAAAIVSALFTALIPSERYSSQIKMLIACCFVIIIANAVKNFAGDDIAGILPDINTEYNDYSVTLREMTAKETANALRLRIKDVLASENIFPKKIYIAVNILDSGSISISEIRLVSVSEADRMKALRLMHSCVGTGTKVYVE